MQNKRILWITEIYPSGSTGASIKTRNTLLFLARQGFRIDVCTTHYTTMVFKILHHKRIHIYTEQIDGAQNTINSFCKNLLNALIPFSPFSVKSMWNKNVKSCIQRLQSEYAYSSVVYDGYFSLQYAHHFQQNAIFISNEDITNLFKQRFLFHHHVAFRFFSLTEWIKGLLYEKKYIPRVTRIWTINEETKQRFIHLTRKPVTIMPMYIPLQNNVFSVSSRHLVFSGHLGWQENIEGIQWFLGECWPKIQAVYPMMHMYITGQMGDNALIAHFKQYANVHFLGYIPDLAHVYKKCALALAPMYINEGIKVKILTYLSYGLPVVARPESVKGLTQTNGIVTASR